tara:strand:- start:9928 stop:12372 length:2445 start_codon:yes stop_codon:yes gene_type:complete
VGGPAEQVTDTVIIAPGEGRLVYPSKSLAWLVENLEVGPDNVLSSIVGPSILKIKPQAFATSSGAFQSTEVTKSVEKTLGSEIGGDAPIYGFKTGKPHSVFFARLKNGGADTLLYRFGSKLYKFNGGASDADEVILSNISTANNPDYPDQYVVINDRIVFTNGVDRAKVISFDGNVVDLGFSKRATTPVVSSPSQPDYDEVPLFYPNSMGYSYPGRIGTPGDVLTGRDGSLLAGSWYYYVQYEDVYGNLSEFSLASESAVIRSNQAKPFKSFEETDAGFVVKDGRYTAPDPDDDGSFTSLDRVEPPEGSEIDDLTRRFLIRSTGSAPSHAVATRVFRTQDTQHRDSTPRFLTRIPGSLPFIHDDNAADTDLGEEWDQVVSVPVFRVACAHQGRLIIANTPGDPGILRRSEPGFPGTFKRDDFIFPDSSGAEITAVASHQGVLLAFTKNNVYAIDDNFTAPRPLLRGVGCVAPRSISALKNGTLIWLSEDGFYGMAGSGEVARISMSLDQVFRDDLNHARMNLATSNIDAETGEYRCALAPAGNNRNLLMFCFDGEFWRRQTLGIDIADMCSTSDFTRYSLAIGTDIREEDFEISSPTEDMNRIPFDKEFDLSRIFVLNRQSTDYFGPPRRIRYRSSWISASEFGLIPTNVRSFYVGLLDAWVGNATVRFYRNGSWKPYVEIDDLLLHGPDDESSVITDSAATAIVGESKVHNPRIFWRQVPVDIQNATSWAFEIEIVGSPSPSPPKTTSYATREVSSWVSLFRDSLVGKRKYLEFSQEESKWELGRMRIAAFSFEMSIATKGSPRGRVPFRQDK